VAKIGVWGIGLQLFLALLLAGVVGAATGASRRYQPSLTPSLAMALWAHVARSAVPGRAAVAWITTFGALRFVARSLTSSAGWRWSPGPPSWIAAGTFGLTVGWLSIQTNTSLFSPALDWSARILGVTGVIVTTDFLLGASRGSSRTIDLVGFLAAAAGLATPLFIAHGPMEVTPDPWWYPWLLPSCFVAFAICLWLRLAQRLKLRHN
jgi:hypothetical protein